MPRVLSAQGAPRYVLREPLGRGGMGEVYAGTMVTPAGEEFERRYVTEVLALTGGNVSRAAELAGVSRRLLTRLLQKHGLRGDDK